MSGFTMAGNDEEFLDALATIRRVVDLSRSFPERPFASGGVVHFVEFSIALSGRFGDVLKVLTDRYGDETITFAATDPDRSSYTPYGVAPAFRLSADALPLGYGEALVWEPGGPIATAFIDTVNDFAVVGSSHTWAVWVQRNWELGVIHSPDQDIVWPAGVGPVFGLQYDINSFRSPPPWGMELTPKVLRELRSNMS